MTAVATITEIRQLALASEGTRGTLAAAPSRFLSADKDSNLDYTRKVLPDPALRGYAAQFPGFAGMTGAKGMFKSPVRVTNVCEMLKMLLGAPTSVEQASFVVTTGVNDAIDFKEGSGLELHATIAAGTYPMGASSADAGSLCAAIRTAMDGATGATLTYTVTYVASTRKLTITASSSTVTLLFATGTNHTTSAASLLGFTAADTSAALAVTSDGTTAHSVWKHTFTQGQTIQLPSYSFFINRGFTDASGNKVKAYNLGQVEKIKFSGKDDATVDIEASLLAQQEATSAVAWSPSFVESDALLFSGTTVKMAGSAPSVPNVTEWSIDLDAGLKPYRPLSQAAYPQDFLAAGPFKGSGDMTVYFMDEVERQKFLNKTLTSLEFLCEGPVAAGGTAKQTLDISLPAVDYEAYPFGDIGGYLGAKVKYSARGSIVAGAFVPLATVYVISTVPSGF